MGGSCARVILVPEEVVQLILIRHYLNQDYSRLDKNKIQAEDRHQYEISFSNGVVARFYWSKYRISRDPRLLSRRPHALCYWGQEASRCKDQSGKRGTYLLKDIFFY